MHIHLVLTNGVPLYRQIVNQVTTLVATGRLADGDELPPIRALAEQLLINPNTVARAYRELEAAGVVAARRTAGTFVTAAAAPLARRECLTLLTDRVDALLAEAGQMNVGADDLVALIRRRAAAAGPRPEET